MQYISLLWFYAIESCRASKRHMRLYFRIIPFADIYILLFPSRLFTSIILILDNIRYIRAHKYSFQV